MARQSGGSVGAFTLIELLVVIAIVAVLAGMLLPVIGLVKEAAKQSTCGSNQRQVIMALIAYATDNEGFTPYADMMSAPAGNEGHRLYYGTLLFQEYLPSDQVVGFAPGVIRGAPSLRWPNVVSCPSFKPQLVPTPANGTNTAYSIRWSWLKVAGENFLQGGAAQLATINANVPLVADAVKNAPGGPTAASLGYAPGYWSVQTVNDARLHLVHGRRRAVCAYADGHAGARAREQLIDEQVDTTALWSPP